MLDGSPALESCMNGCGPVMFPFETERLATIACAMENTSPRAPDKFEGICWGGGTSEEEKTE